VLVICYKPCPCLATIFSLCFCVHVRISASTCRCVLCLCILSGRFCFVSRFFVCVCTCFPVPAGGLACTCQVLFVLLDCFRFGFFCLTYCATTEFCFVLACFDSLGVQKPKQSSRLHWTSFERLGRITLSLWQYVHVCGL